MSGVGTKRPVDGALRQVAIATNAASRLAQTKPSPSNPSGSAFRGRELEVLEHTPHPWIHYNEPRPSYGEKERRSEMNEHLNPANLYEPLGRTPRQSGCPETQSGLLSPGR